MKNIGLLSVLLIVGSGERERPTVDGNGRMLGWKCIDVCVIIIIDWQIDRDDLPEVNLTVKTVPDLFSGRSVKVPPFPLKVSLRPVNERRSNNWK